MVLNLTVNYTRLENESEEELIYRICSDKEKIGTWYDVADVLNSLLDYDYGESTYRKKFQSFQKLLKANESKFVTDSAYLDEIKEQRMELDKTMVKVRDERTELRRIIREQARKESLWELLERVLTTYKPITFTPVLNKKVATGGNDLVIHLTDLHSGIKIDNSFNQFNADILRKRLTVYLEKICEIKDRHGSEGCTVILGGDVISGLIHPTIRLENEKDIIQQTMDISEILSEFIAQLANWFVYVQIGAVSGNHGRCQPQKELNAKGENFERFVPFYIKARLQNFTNVYFIDNTIDESIGSCTIRGQLIYFVHGDKDSTSNIVQNLTLMTGRKPDICYMGHRHTNGLTTVYNTKVIESGCVSGSDNYCMDRRLFNYPEQTVSVITNNGLDCLYDIQL